MKFTTYCLFTFCSSLLSTLTDSPPIVMEKINFEYSTKNIPLPSRSQYMKKFIEKTKHLLRRMRWKAYHFLNPSELPARETYGFKSRNSPPPVDELKSFEDGMLNLIQNIKFKDNKCHFQSKLHNDIKNNIKKTDSLPADKTTNYYTMTTTSYKEVERQRR